MNQVEDQVWSNAPQDAPRLGNQANPGLQDFWWEFRQYYFICQWRRRPMWGKGETSSFKKSFVAGHRYALLECWSCSPQQWGMPCGFS